MTEARAILAYEANKKSAGLAYVLWFVFGGLGVHRFYLGRPLSALVMLLITLISIPAMFIGIGLILIWIPTIWWFVDLILIPGMTRDYNLRVIQRIS